MAAKPLKRRTKISTNLDTIRVNDDIRVREIRLIDENGNQIGIVPTTSAKQEASSLGLDLVEINPNARPPVCKMMNFGKYKFELKKKEKEAKSRQKVVELKQINFHPNTQYHDYTYRLEQAKGFIKSGNKVKATVTFRGREMNFLSNGKEILDKMTTDLKEVATVEVNEMEGKQMFVVFRPV